MAETIEPGTFVSSCNTKKHAKVNMNYFQVDTNEAGGDLGKRVGFP
jgi:hypothetical protein